MLKCTIAIAVFFCMTQSVAAKDYETYDTTAFRNTKTNCKEIYSAPQESMCDSDLYELNKEEELTYKEFLTWVKSAPNTHKNSIAETIDFKIVFSKNLKNSESAWENYRDSTCSLDAEAFSGTQQSSIIIQCLAEKKR